MNSFNDLMNDEVYIKEQTLETKGFGDKVDGDSLRYDARVVEVYITVENSNGVLVYPDYKVLLTKDVPTVIDNSAIIVYESNDYTIKRKNALKDQHGVIVGWVIFI